MGRKDKNVIQTDNFVSEAMGSRSYLKPIPEGRFYLA